MSTKELQERAIKALENVPEHLFPALVEMLEEINELPKDDSYLSRARRIIEEKRELFRRLAGS